MFIPTTLRLSAALLLIGLSAFRAGATTILPTAPFAAVSAGQPRAVTRSRKMHSALYPNASCNAAVGKHSFIGVHDNNVAASLDSAVLGGALNWSCDSWAVIAGGQNNLIYSAVNYGEVGAWYASFIGAGTFNNIDGGNSAVSAGEANSINGNGSFIGAGGTATCCGGIFEGNTLSAADAFIGAGDDNYVTGSGSFIGAGGFSSGGLPNVVSGMDAFLGAGDTNSVAGFGSFIGTGIHNSNAAYAAFIGAGASNIITPGSAGSDTGAAYAVIDGGLSNTVKSLVSGGAKYGFIGAGHANSLSAFAGVITGGVSNSAAGNYAVVPGGIGNVASGSASFAAGTGSQALANGTFVWSDDARGAKALEAAENDQFLVRASGGVTFYSNAALKSGVTLKPGAGSWSSLSDRASKTNIAALDPDTVLAKVEHLPVTEWSYRTEDASIRHVGPMAQDFYAAFGVGEDARHITTIDEDGVALAAIKGLAAKNARLEAKIRELESHDADVATREAKLESEVARLLAK